MNEENEHLSEEYADKLLAAEAANKIADILTHTYINMVQPLFQCREIPYAKLQPWMRYQVAEFIKAFPELRS